MARAIQPLATQDDGDTLFAVTTGEVDNPTLSAVDLGVVASEVAWDAVLASLPPLPPAGPETPISVPARDLGRYAGTYEFVPGTRAVVARGPNGLTIQLDDHQSLYLPRNEAVGLLPVAPDEFNPGHWGVPATRLP